MKLHINPQQLNDLSEKGRERLRKWRKPRDGDMMANYKNSKVGMIGVNYWLSPKRLKTHKCFLPLLSIGQMIEYLVNNKTRCIIAPIAEDNPPRLEWIVCNYGANIKSQSTELVDALWEACKEILDD